jgi:hypothetical protein
MALSDADGSLGLEQFSARVTDSTLLSLSIDLIFDDLARESEIKFDTHLDIPKFKAFAAALGSVRRDCRRRGATHQCERNHADRPNHGYGNAYRLFAAGAAGAVRRHRHRAASPVGLIMLSSINAVYEANVDENDADVFDYSKVWQTLAID